MNEPVIKPRDKRRYAETIRQAHLGAREAQYQVGLMYANGVGTPQNLALAIEWVAKAANKGLPAAQYLLATRYALGIVVERDERVALAWYLRAAQQGYAKAILALGRFFAEPHPQLADSHVEEAAQAGNAESQYALALALGKQAAGSKDQERAAHWLAAAARQGHSKAQVLLGRAYATGHGVAQDLEQAREWLRLAVRQNSPLAHLALAELDGKGGRGARTNLRSRAAERRETREKWDRVQMSLDPEETHALGAMYEKGLGVARNIERATELYRIAAERGDSQAQCGLARLLAVEHRLDALQWAEQAAKDGSVDGMLLAGTLHTENMERSAGGALAATAWFSQAAIRDDSQGAKGLLQIMKNSANELEAECLLKQALDGDAQAQLEYGVCLELGRGVAQSSSEAKRWIALAAEAGYAKAQIRWALSILESQAGDSYMTQAAHWLEKAALQGDHLAQWHLGGLFAKGGPGLEQDLKQAFYWCRLAANGGFAPAQANLAYLYSRIGDREAAGPWLEKAAQAGDSEAQFNLAIHIGQSVTSESGLKAAAAWLLAAAEQGLAVAQTELGLRYARGSGVPVDPVEAHKWFFLAVEQGEPAALTNMKFSESQLSDLQRDEGTKRAKTWTSRRRI